MEDISLCSLNYQCHTASLLHRQSKPIPVVAPRVRRRSLAGIAVSNPAGGITVSCESCELSGRGLCDGPIPHPRASFRVCVCVCLSTSGIFFFHWHYSPLWALACRTMSFHFFSYLPPTLHLLTPSTSRSLSTSFPSFPGSFPSCPFQFLSEDLFGHPILLHSL